MSICNLGRLSKYKAMLYRALMAQEMVRGKGACEREGEVAVTVIVTGQGTLTHRNPIGISSSERPT